MFLENFWGPRTFDSQVDFFSDRLADTVTRNAYVQSRIVSVQTDNLQGTIGEQPVMSTRHVDLKINE